MFIAFDVKKGVEYAKICSSKWENGKTRKDYTYLGRVIDKEKGVFFNRKQGYCSFDESENKVVCLTDYHPTSVKEKIEHTTIRDKEDDILLFGPTYF